MIDNDSKVSDPGVEAPGSAPNEGIGGAIKALIDDGQTLIQAEIAYRKVQAAYGLAQAKAIAILIVLGLAFGFFTLLALVVGLLLALSMHFGVWGALAIVGGVLGVLAGICLLLALRKISRAKAALISGSRG